jgi:hypothetical protein
MKDLYKVGETIRAIHSSSGSYGYESWYFQPRWSAVSIIFRLKAFNQSTSQEHEESKTNFDYLE